MKQRFRADGKPLTERDCIVMGLKSTFSYEDLRYITSELQAHLSPRIPAEEAAPRRLPLDPPPLGGAVVAYPRKAPGFES